MASHLPFISPQLSNGSKVFTDFVRAGLIEYLDVNEENNALVAIYESHVIAIPTPPHLAHQSSLSLCHHFLHPPSIACFHSFILFISLAYSISSSNVHSLTHFLGHLSIRLSMTPPILKSILFPFSESVLALCRTHTTTSPPVIPTSVLWENKQWVPSVTTNSRESTP